MKSQNRAAYAAPLASIVCRRITGGPAISACRPTRSKPVLRRLLDIARPLHRQVPIRDLHPRLVPGWQNSVLAESTRKIWAHLRKVPEAVSPVLRIDPIDWTGSKNNEQRPESPILAERLGQRLRIDPQLQWVTGRFVPACEGVLLADPESRRRLGARPR